MGVMTVDFSEQLYNPVYAVLGVPAVLSVAGSGGAEVDITVIDDTRPNVLPIAAGGGTPAEVRSVGPGAFARVPELAEKGIARADYADAVLAFNGRTWIVRSWELRGSPNGEDMGEVRFALKADSIG
jgi:hypothetical protein